MKPYPGFLSLFLVAQMALSSCGANDSKLSYTERVLEELGTDEAASQRGDWRLKAYTTSEGLKVLVVSAKPVQEVEFRPLFVDTKGPAKPMDRRLDAFRWGEGFESRTRCMNLSEEMFGDVAEWISDHGDWDDEDTALRWEDSWVSSVIDGTGPYPRYKEIGEVWVVDSGVEVEALDRDSTHLAQWACMGIMPFGIISFYPEHTETARAVVTVKVYDCLNRRFRAEKELKASMERERVHSWGSDWLGVLTCGAFNFSSRATFLWIPCYDTDSPGVVSDVVDEMEELEDGVRDLFDGAQATRPDTEPAQLRVRSEGSRMDSSRVVNVPIVVTNSGRGSGVNVRVLVKAANSSELEGIVPAQVELGDLRPGDTVERIVRFRLPSTVKEKELVLVLEPKDESPREYRKVQVRVPLR